MKPKKKIKLSNAEKQRLYRERRKNNQQKDEEAKRKDRERYHAKKKLVHQMSLRELRLHRKKVKARVQKHRKNKKNCLPLTPPDSPYPDFPEVYDPVPGGSMNTPRRVLSSRSSTPSSTGSSCSAVTSISRQAKYGRKQIRRDRSKLYKENENLKKQRDAAVKKAEMYRKRYDRLQKSRLKSLYSIPEEKMSPKSLTEKTVRECLPGKLTPRKKKIARQLLIQNTTSTVMKKEYTSSLTKLQKMSLKKAVAPLLVKYRIAHSTLASFLGIKTGIRKCLPVPKNLSESRKKAVKEFFLRDDNSRTTAGKKETITKNQEKRQKRFLCDTMKNLYKKYLKEGYRVISYSTFASCRPFYVLIPNVKDRDTCLCKLHSNLQFKADKLKQLKITNTNNLTQLAHSCVCDPKNIKCMYRECKECKNRKVPMNSLNELSINDETRTSWWEWNIATISRTSMKSGKEEMRNVKRTVKIQKEGTIIDLINSLQKQMKVFCKHIFNIRQQFLAYKECHDNLKENEALVHIDFSESYSCKISAEIQSFHFGDSRAQVTLHTGVAYTVNAKEAISFCSISPDRRHNPAAIWAHLDPVIKLLRNKMPAIDTLHIFSDGPVTQYRQKENFFLFNKRLLHYGYRRGTWSFFEAGHGKGAPDGIGGAVKRTADRLVTYGNDIMNAKQLFDTLKKEDTAVKLFFITSEEIDYICQELPPSISALKGTLQVHQLYTELEGQLKYRFLSCFCHPQRGLCNCFPYADFSLKGGTVKKKVSGKGKKKRQSISDSDSSENSDSMKSNDGEDSEDDFIMAKNALYEDIPTYIEVTPEKIKKGVFLLVEFLGGVRKKSHYRYVGVAQEDLDDDGYVQIMFLKVYDDSGAVYKIDENDVSDVEFNQIKKILPTPSLLQKGGRILYKFPYSIDVLEKM